MSQCIHHKTTFPDAHRHFRMAIEISRGFPTACGVLELEKSNFQTHMPAFVAHAISICFVSFVLYLEYQDIWLNMFIYTDFHIESHRHSKNINSEPKTLNMNYISFFIIVQNIIPQTSVALGVLAVLVED